MQDDRLLNKNEILERYFGFRSFRRGQEEIVDSLLSGRDALAIMPTGAGKSLCYQVPALMMDGIALVISPLISLMKDQVNALTAQGVRAAYLNRSLTDAQLDKARRTGVRHHLRRNAPRYMPQKACHAGRIPAGQRSRREKAEALRREVHRGHQSILRMTVGDLP